jgi:predicted nucleic acid-binding protein
MSRFALDTNILIYSHDKTNYYKQDKARDLIVQSPVISTQVISEYINVLKRIMPLGKDNLFNLCIQTLEKCHIHSISISTMKLAEQIIRYYDLQIFDSVIVASAIEADCEILYSEDMQHNIRIYDKLNIINPFL